MIVLTFVCVCPAEVSPFIPAQDVEQTLKYLHVFVFLLQCHTVVPGPVCMSARLVRYLEGSAYLPG